MMDKYELKGDVMENLEGITQDYCRGIIDIHQYRRDTKIQINRLR